MARSIHHVCLSLAGAVSHWKAKEWRTVAAENGMTPAQLKKTFELYIFEGKRVIPIGDQCEGFSYQTGCPGHPQQDEATDG